MPSQTQNHPVALRVVVSVSAMAKAVGLSRSRFYDYVRRGVFPSPCYSLTTKRPFYAAEARQEILEVRQTGIGVNGEYVLFYQRSASVGVTQKSRTAPAATGSDMSGLMAGLSGLGLTELTVQQVEKAVAACFPAGTAGHDDGTVLRTLNRHFRSTNRVGNSSDDRRGNVRPANET